MALGSALSKIRQTLTEAVPTNEDVLALKRRAESMTVKQLKDYLREHELPLSGNKAELVERVTVDMAQEMLTQNYVAAVDERAAADE